MYNMTPAYKGEKMTRQSGKILGVFLLVIVVISAACN